MFLYVLCVCHCWLAANTSFVGEGIFFGGFNLALVVVLQTVFFALFHLLWLSCVMLLEYCLPTAAGI